MKYLTDYINSMAGLRGEWISDRKVPLDLTPLFTYGMTVLEIPNIEKQKILENQSLKSQIDAFISILLKETKKNQINLIYAFKNISQILRMNNVHILLNIVILSMHFETRTSRGPLTATKYQ